MGDDSAPFLAVRAQPCMTPRCRRAILASCQEPLDSRDRPLADVFAAEVNFHAARRLTSLYIFENAGEGYAIDSPMFRELSQLFYDVAARSSIDAMVGVIQLSTASVAERLAIAYDIGFRRFQVALPDWLTDGEPEVMSFFADVSGDFPDCEFLHYNVGHAERQLAVVDYRRLADAAPNLGATKNASGGVDCAADLKRTVPDLQHFFGEDNYLHGECSLLTTLGVLAPALTHQYFEAGVAHYTSGSTNCIANFS